MSNVADFIVENDTLIKYTGSDEHVVIPEGIICIGRIAFWNNRTLRSVSLPNSLERIEDSAFANTYLEDVRFGANLNYIGESCFIRCNQLKEIAIPEGVEVIEPACFKWCMNLETVFLPESLMRLGGGAFEGCTNLKSVKMPSGLKEIESSTFKQCTALEDICIPPAVEKIGMWAFYYCRSLRKIVLPDSVKEIGQQAFLECSSLEKVVLGNGLQRLENELFIHCKALKEIYVPDSVVAMGEGVFKNCGYIVAGYFSDRLSLAARANEDKEWIAYLFCLAPEKHSPERTEEMLPYLSRQKKWILRRAIWENAPIVVENLFKMGVAQPKHVEEAEMYSFGTEISQEIRSVMYAYKPVPKVAKKKEQVPGMPLAEAKKLWTLTQDEGCNYIIKGYTGAEEVVEIPDMIAGKPVVAIADEAFKTFKSGRTSAQCSALRNLTSIKLPLSVATIGEDSFAGLNIVSMEIPETVQVIGVAAFGVCDKLETLVLPKSLKEIPERLCVACTALKEVDVPATVEAIGKNAFARCSALTLIVHNDVAENYAKENGIPYVRK